MGQTTASIREWNLGPLLVLLQAMAPAPVKQGARKGGLAGRGSACSMIPRNLRPQTSLVCWRNLTSHGSRPASRSLLCLE